MTQAYTNLASHGDAASLPWVVCHEPAPSVAKSTTLSPCFMLQRQVPLQIEGIEVRRHWCYNGIDDERRKCSYMDRSLEVQTEELRRKVNQISFRHLTKYQAAEVAKHLAEAAMELVVVAREPDEDMRLYKSHRVVMKLIADLERLA